MMKVFVRWAWVSVLLLSVAPVAHAQWAVVDVGAINQLIQEVSVLRQSLTTAQQELSEARSQYAAVTGSYGMSRLLSGVNRNYLPTDWTQIQSVLQGSSGPYGMLATQVQSLVASNAVLSAQQFATLSPKEQSRVLADRRSAALLQAMTRAALSTTSARFASLEQLIAAIPQAQNEKAVLDLQARIGAEQTLLETEQTKLQTLYEMARAERQAQAEQAREEAIADIGSFSALPPLQF